MTETDILIDRNRQLEKQVEYLRQINDDAHAVILHLEKKLMAYEDMNTVRRLAEAEKRA